jgi:hypothetical protein
MSDDLRIITNNVPRLVIDAYELTADERAQFDYLDWSAIDDGRDSATFTRYRGVLMDVGEFTVTDLPGWDGIHHDSFFSGTLIRLCVDDSDSVVMARYYA